jgi:2-dehydro-3-deoxyphosphogalactonate aldolase
MADHVARFDKVLREAPVIAILRGLQPHEVDPVGDALVAAGIRIIEVPLNSPDPFTSIARLVERLGQAAVIGAGTVRRMDDVEKLAKIGAGLVLSPHCDPALIRGTVATGMVSVPGILTPTEAFAALDAGAHALKLFPMEVMGIAGARALKAVLPTGTRMIAVGGVSEANARSFLEAGLHGVGVGSALYKPGALAADIEHRAGTFMRAIGPGQDMQF